MKKESRWQKCPQGSRIKFELNISRKGINMACKMNNTEIVSMKENLVNYESVNQYYSGLISGAMMEGWKINTTTMGGSQGEIARIDMTDGKTVRRYLIRWFTEANDEAWSVEGVEILVGDCTDNQVKPHSSMESVTVWNNRLTEVYRRRFYEVARMHGAERIYGTKEQAEAANRKVRDRHIAMVTKTRKEFAMTPKITKVAKNVIRKKTDVKKIYEDELKAGRDSSGYYVAYRNRKIYLH